MFNEQRCEARTQKSTKCCWSRGHSYLKNNQNQRNWTSQNRSDPNTEQPNVQQRRDCGALFKKKARDLCSVKTVKKRIPIFAWLPYYNLTLFVQDVIAGITVGLTAIPQSIAYAIVAGLEPQYGLYSAFIGGFVYLFFGSSKDVTVGPTAILAVMVSKYVVGYGPDFAILAAFLSGCVCLVLGIFNLGFLVDFISNPVISGFTTAAAMQIASTQLKSLFGLSGAAGTTFVEAVINFVRNVKTIKIWDTGLGVATIVMLLLLKELSRFSSRTDVVGFSFARNLLWKMNWFVSLARNAVVVVIGIVIAYCIKIYLDIEPFTLTGEIHGGLPQIKPPPFSTVVGNETYTFTDMLDTFGPQSIVLPLISILESIAIAKAFAKGKTLDATQEMIALGMCNVAGSFLQSMPVTGSFTRTAINYASGVQTPAGGIFKGLLVILALSLLTKTFYYIPRATLAGLIMTAMFSMIDYAIILQLWRKRRSEWCVLVVTALMCLYIGLEYGIISGILADACLLLFRTSRPNLRAELTKVGGRSGVIITPSGSLRYCAADNLSRFIQSTVAQKQQLHICSLLVILDGRNVLSMDTTVAKNLVAVVTDLEKKSHSVVFCNFSTDVQALCEEMAPNTVGKFITMTSLQHFGHEPTDGAGAI